MDTAIVTRVRCEERWSRLEESRGRWGGVEDLWEIELKSLSSNISDQKVHLRELHIVSMTVAVVNPRDSAGVARAIFWKSKSVLEPTPKAFIISHAHNHGHKYSFICEQPFAQGN